MTTYNNNNNTSRALRALRYRRAPIIRVRNIRLKTYSQRWRVRVEWSSIVVYVRSGPRKSRHLDLSGVCKQLSNKRALFGCVVREGQGFRPGSIGRRGRYRDASPVVRHAIECVCVANRDARTTCVSSRNDFRSNGNVRFVQKRCSFERKSGIDGWRWGGGGQTRRGLETRKFPRKKLELIRGGRRYCSKSENERYDANLAYPSRRVARFSK